MEPIENAFLTFRLAITFPRFRTEEEQIITWRQDYTQLQAQMRYTHPTTGQTKTLVIPNLTFVTAERADGGSWAARADHRGVDYARWLVPPPVPRSPLPAMCSRSRRARFPRSHRAPR